MVFDKSGNRIGYGPGYYDKFLSNLKIKKIALIWNTEDAKAGVYGGELNLFHHDTLMDNYQLDDLLIIQKSEKVDYFVVVLLALLLLLIILYIYFCEVRKDHC